MISNLVTRSGLSKAGVVWSSVLHRLGRAVRHLGEQLRPRLRPLTSERGQALLELAFVLPVMLIFLLTLVDFGVALDRREVIQHAVREGARQGAVGLSEAEIVDVVVAQSQDVLEAGDIEVCYAEGPGGESPGSAGSNLRVSATFTYQFSMGAGEMLDAIGVDPNSLDVEMTPSAESRTETSVAGISECT